MRTQLVELEEWEELEIFMNLSEPRFEHQFLYFYALRITSERYWTTSLPTQVYYEVLSYPIQDLASVPVNWYFFEKRFNKSTQLVAKGGWSISWWFTTLFTGIHHHSCKLLMFEEWTRTASREETFQIDRSNGSVPSSGGSAILFVLVTPPCNIWFFETPKRNDFLSLQGPHISAGLCDHTGLQRAKCYKRGRELCSLLSIFFCSGLVQVFYISFLYKLKIGSSRPIWVLDSVLYVLMGYLINPSSTEQITTSISSFPYSTRFFLHFRTLVYKWEKDDYRLRYTFLCLWLSHLGRYDTIKHWDESTLLDTNQSIKLNIERLGKRFIQRSIQKSPSKGSK